MSSKWWLMCEWKCEHDNIINKCNIQISEWTLNMMQHYNTWRSMMTITIIHSTKRWTRCDENKYSNRYHIVIDEISERVCRQIRRSHNTIISDGDDVNSVPWSWSSVSQCERHVVCKESSCVYTWDALCFIEDHTFMITTQVSEWVIQHELRVIMIINIRITIMLLRYERWLYHKAWVIWSHEHDSCECSEW